MKKTRKITVFKKKKNLKELFLCLAQTSDITKEYHSDIVTVEMGLNHFNDTPMAHFWKVQKSKLKQRSLNLVFKQPSVDERVRGQFSKRSISSLLCHLHKCKLHCISNMQCIQCKYNEPSIICTFIYSI